ncbi:YqhG family protein [Cohnella sp. AR92]|uniref:YqhG family protein n=1 Tax=Cohnella sp. AR92 TaxID=648716 RepID=UPI000F8EB4D1|nr:YqhG family protein [Cohnella sp. AR92]RUS43933.1 hypothetical protein ELR57_24020 [Cohnella sp. AR92]
MNAKQAQKFALSYLQATQCHIIEKSPNHVTVKLSPEADRALTGRPYYWSFVDRTGSEPETMTYRWNFHAPGEEEPSAGAASTHADLFQPNPAVPGPQAAPLQHNGVRVIQDDVYFGSRRLAQLFDSIKQAGRCVTLFAEPTRGPGNPLSSQPYTAWLGANFKVGYECDMKREELYGVGISLATGVIEERFLARLRETRLTPRLPSNVHLLRNGLSLRKAMSQLESALERKIKQSDFRWAEEAEERRLDELERVDQYYKPMIERSATNEQREAITARYEQRAHEIDWQYRPRVTLSVINCGIFHLPGIE